MDQLLLQVAARPWLRWPLYFLYAVLFYNAGLATTTLLIEREAFAGGWQWLWVIAFPLLLVGFFVLNRYLGCAAGTCVVGRGRPPGYNAPPGN